MKLEVGKSYKNVKGDVIKIINRLRGPASFPYYDEEGVSYKEDGSAVYRPSDFNLIEEVEAEEPSLKLEVGKSYKNRYGDVRKIIKCKGRHFKLPFIDVEGFSYDEHGGYGGYGVCGSSTMHDLIEEVDDQEPPLKLEVGKYYKNGRGGVRKIIGYVVGEGFSLPPFIDENGLRYKEDGSSLYLWSSLDLVEEVKAEEVKEPDSEMLLVPKGRVLQYRTSKDSEWEDIHTCSGDFEYRVKPSRETVVEYSNVYSNGGASVSCRQSNNIVGRGQSRLSVLKITTTFDGDKPNLPTVEVISHEDALKMEA